VDSHLKVQISESVHLFKQTNKRSKIMVQLASCWLRAIHQFQRFHGTSPFNFHKWWALGLIWTYSRESE